MVEDHLCITTAAPQAIKLDSEVAFGHDKSDLLGQKTEFTIFIRKPFKLVGGA